MKKHTIARRSLYVRPTKSVLYALLVSLALGTGVAPARAQSLEWIEVPVLPEERPPVRGHHAMAYHPDNGVVLFGGVNLDVGYLDDTWAFDGSVWLAPTASGPAGRAFHAMVYAPACGGVLLFGGSNDSGGLDDMWLWDGASWSEIAAPPDPWPSARASHAIAYDPAREVVVLFGGCVGGPPWIYADDTWEWDCSTPGWEEKPISGPIGREGHAMRYDLETGIVLFGGGDGGIRNDTWKYEDGVWTQIAPPLPTIDPSRMWVPMVYDDRRECLVLFGGCDDYVGGGLNDTWEWTTEGWEQIHADNPSVDPAPRSRHAAAFDKLRGVTVMFGGILSDNTTYLSDTWEYPAYDVPIPAVSEWGIVVMTLLMLTAGTLVLGRWRTVTG